jgi:hypothetical protein
MGYEKKSTKLQSLFSNLKYKDNDKKCTTSYPLTLPSLSLSACGRDFVKGVKR